MSQTLPQLLQLANLVLDHRLSQLQAAARLRDQTTVALAHLASDPAPAADLQGAAADLARLAYLRWADGRRAELDQVLLRQTEDWRARQQEARLAFGKVEALRGLQAQNPTPR